MIEIESKGSFNNTEQFLRKAGRGNFFSVLDDHAREIVRALAQATPLDSGETANSWTYDVIHRRGRHEIVIRNTHIVEGSPVAILIQYGHATGTGGYIPGRDYINPVIGPLFEKITRDVWEEVRK